MATPLPQSLAAEALSPHSQTTLGSSLVHGPRCRIGLGSDWNLGTPSISPQIWRRRGWKEGKQRRFLSSWERRITIKKETASQEAAPKNKRKESCRGNSDKKWLNLTRLEDLLWGCANSRLIFCRSYSLAESVRFHLIGIATLGSVAYLELRKMELVS